MSETYQAVERERNRLGVRVIRLEAALLTMIDQMVGAYLTAEVIDIAKQALKKEQET